MAQRNYPDAPRVYVDMDGVIADFGAACVRRGLMPDQLKRIAGAYRSLCPLAGAKEAIAALDAAGIEVFVLTKIPSENPGAATEKLLWIQANFPSIADRVVITPDKGCVGSARDVLVDDNPEWANADHFRGTLVRFTGNWAPALAAVFAAIKTVARPSH